MRPPWLAVKPVDFPPHRRFHCPIVNAQPKPRSRWRTLPPGSRLRPGDQWRGGSGHWFPVKPYNLGATIPSLDRYKDAFRRPLS